MGGIDWDCFVWSTRKWPDPQEPCNFDNVDKGGIDSRPALDGETLQVYDEAPIVIGTIVEFTGEPRRIRLDYDLDWVNRRTGEEPVSINTGHDSTRDAGEGRYYLWWGWSFFLNPAESNYGDPYALEGVVEDEISGETALISTTFLNQNATVRDTGDINFRDISISR